jgi:hypothetical protein
MLGSVYEYRQGRTIEKCVFYGAGLFTYTVRPLGAHVRDGHHLSIREGK